MSSVQVFCLLNIFRRKMFGRPFAISRGVRCFAAISIVTRAWRVGACFRARTSTLTHSPPPTARARARAGLAFLSAALAHHAVAAMAAWTMVRAHRVTLARQQPRVRYGCAIPVPERPFRQRVTKYI